MSNLLFVKLVTSAAFAFLFNSVVRSSLFTFLSNASFTLPAVTSLFASPLAVTSLAKLGVTLTLPFVFVTEMASLFPLSMVFTSLLDAIVTALPFAVKVILLPATNFTL